MCCGVYVLGVFCSVLCMCVMLCVSIVGDALLSLFGYVLFMLCVVCRLLCLINVPPWVVVCPVCVLVMFHVFVIASPILMLYVCV